MLPRIRENLTLVLLALLPLHAFAVTVLTKVFAGNEAAPITLLALWKEVFLLAVIFVAILEITAAVSGWRLASSKTSSTSYTLPATRSFDALDIFIVLALLYSLLIHPWGEIGATTSYIFGFRYDFVPLVSFFILRRVSWSNIFLKRAFTVLLTVGAVVAGYGLLTLVFPDSVFTLLGYSPMHSLYIADGPIAAFQQISETGVRRIQSTFSGPNQFGLWLLVPLSIVLSSWKSARAVSGWRVAGSALILMALLLTFSRSAWIGAILIGILMLGPIVRRRVLTLGTVVVLVLGITAAVVLPHIVVRTLSTSAHVTRPLAAMQLIGENPFGLGLGSAGPASNRTSDTCVELREGSDASWAEPHQNLCVFVGGVQVQPVTECNCPILPENWYLQWGVELGFFGFFVSILFVLIALGALKIENGKLNTSPVFTSLLAVSVAGLFLHSFEDSAVSYTLWILLSATLPLWKRPKAQSSS